MSSSEPTHLLYEFGPFRLETEKNMLFRGEDEQVRVGPSEFRILLYLIENRARAVSRDELYNKFLSKDDPKKVVEESNVYVKISALRKALGEKVGENKYIQTVEDTYRFVAKDLAVTAVAPGTNAADPATPTRAARAGNIVVEDSKDGMDTFEGWLVGPGKFITMFLLVYVIATVILSVEGVDRQWEFTTLAVSIAHIIFLLVIALPYPLSGPKEFYPVEELTRGGVLNEEVRFSTGYDDPREWGDDSEIAQKSLERYKIYWRGVLFAWLLLYGCLTLVVHPYLDLNCRIDTTRFCKSNVKDPADLAAALKDERVPSSRYLRDLLPAGARKELDDYDGSLPPSLSLQQDLIDGLNQRLRDCCLYSEERFAKDKLPEETRRLVGRQLEGERLISFNRSLLTAAYPLSHPDESKQFWSVVVNIANTSLNNFSSLMIILCFNILNKPAELKKGSRNISDTPWMVGSAFVLIFALAELLLVLPPLDYGKYQILKWGGWASGIFGGIAMALYFGRLQSKFLGPRAWLLIALFSYTAIQSLFVFLEERRTAAVVLIDGALILKCLLFLYMAWLFQSGRLLFYLVRVRRTYLDVKTEWPVFRRILKKTEG